MKLFNATLSLAAVSTLLCSAAVAQTRFCIGGDLDHMTQAEKASCSAKVQAVRTASAALHAPDNWHFVVVCGEEGWKNYAAYSMDNTAALLNASADTNLEERETFLREDRLDLHDVHGLERVVAHEIAGIVLQSKDEAAIAKQVALWMPHESSTAGL